MEGGFDNPGGIGTLGNADPEKTGPGQSSISRAVDYVEGSTFGKRIAHLTEDEIANPVPGQLSEEEAERRLRNRKLKQNIRKRLKGTQWDELASDVIEETMKLAFFDIGEIYHADGTMKGVEEMDPDTRAAVTGVDVTEHYDREGNLVTTNTKKKLADKLRALEMLGKWLRLFADRLEVEGVDDLAARLARGRQNALKEASNAAEFRKEDGGQEGGPNGGQ